MTIFLALLCACFWGFSEINLKQTINKYKTHTILFYSYLIQTITYLLTIIVLDIDAFKRFDINIYKYLLPFFLMKILSTVIYNFCIRNGKISIISPLLASDPIFSIIIGMLLFKEAQSLTHIIAIIIVTICIIILQFNKTDTKKKASKIAIFLASFYAIWVALITTVEKAIYLGGYQLTDLYFHYLFLDIIMILILIIINIIKDKKIKKPNYHLLKSLTENHLGYFVYSYLLTFASMSLVVPLTSLYSVITQVVAKIKLKEKLTIYERLIVSLIIISTFWLLIF